MNGSVDQPVPWTPWCVAPHSGFEVQGPDGEVGLVQIDAGHFWVTQEFRFSNEEVENALVDKMQSRGETGEAARKAVDDARTFTPLRENPTDLASIPRFMRWFENAYGLHTLAAIIHDQLIVDAANGGALKSDTLSDRFFREMLQSAGVKWLKRWIIWSAVAMRTRWAAGGLRRASLCLWALLAVSGITAFVDACGAQWLGWSHPAGVGVLIVVAVLLPFVSAPLWGRQFGASLIAALAVPWILPAAAFAVVGYFVYLGLEWLFGRVGYR